MDDKPREPAPWLRRVDLGQGKIYISILKALETAIQEGELQPGDQLPPQRQVASLLNIDFTTVTRAYTAARNQGLVEAAVGRGTFVSRQMVADETGRMVLGLNGPPAPQGLSVGQLLRDTTREILERTDLHRLLAYHQGAGSVAQRAAGADWVAPCLGETGPGRILVCSGGQLALAALLTAQFSPGDTIVVEPLTYRGLIVLARYLRLNLMACPADEHGVMPQALADICRDHRPKALYCVPTFSTTTATVPPDRRRAIAETCRAYDLTIIEDDAYGRLASAPPLAISAYAPERSWYVATLSKALSPALRHAFVVAPNEDEAQRLMLALRHLAIMPSPMTSAVATQWIREGVAEQLLAAIRAETQERVALAREVLPQAHSAPECFHIWLDLPGDCDNPALMNVLRPQGLSAVTAEVFSVEPTPERNGVRLSLGGPRKRVTLEKALGRVGDVLQLVAR